MNMNCHSGERRLGIMATECWAVAIKVVIFSPVGSNILGSSGSERFWWLAPRSHSWHSNHSAKNGKITSGEKQLPYFSALFLSLSGDVAWQSLGKFRILDVACQLSSE